MGVYIYKKNWKKGADSYNDDNPIHRRASAALRHGLENIIAPGVWVASHIQGSLGNFSSIRQIKFLGNVYEGDMLHVADSGFFRNKVNYFFERIGLEYKETGERKGIVPEESRNVVCEVKGVEYGEYSKCPEIFSSKDVSHVFNFSMEPRDLRKFLQSIGMDYYGEVPNAYLLALSASSLLDMGKEKGFVGIHALQSFYVHGRFNAGKPVHVLIGKEKDKRGLAFFDQQWVQNGSVKASGRAGVKLISGSEVVAPNFLRDLFIDLKYAMLS